MYQMRQTSRIRFNLFSGVCNNWLLLSSYSYGYPSVMKESNVWEMPKMITSWTEKTMQPHEVSFAILCITFFVPSYSLLYTTLLSLFYPLVFSCIFPYSLVSCTFCTPLYLICTHLYSIRSHLYPLVPHLYPLVPRLYPLVPSCILLSPLVSPSSTYLISSSLVPSPLLYPQISSLTPCKNTDKIL